MPDFEYRGAPGMYPMLRDVYDVPAGTVKPGDILRFEEAPDADWVLYEDGGDGTGDGTPDGSGEGASGPQDAPQDESSSEGEAPDAGSEQDDNDAGQPGSEEG